MTGRVMCEDVSVDLGQGDDEDSLAKLMTTVGNRHSAENISLGDFAGEALEVADHVHLVEVAELMATLIHDLSGASRLVSSAIWKRVPNPDETWMRRWSHVTPRYAKRCVHLYNNETSKTSMTLG